MSLDVNFSDELKHGKELVISTKGKGSDSVCFIQIVLIPGRMIQGQNVVSTR